MAALRFLFWTVVVVAFVLLLTMAVGVFNIGTLPPVPH